MDAILCEIFKFREATQLPEETLNQFMSIFAYGKCNFHSIDDEIKSQIISKCSDRRFTQRALEVPNITLKKLLDTSNTMESAFQQAKSIENHVKPQNQAAAINKINQSNTIRTRHSSSMSAHTSNQSQWKQTNPLGKTSARCYFCDKEYSHKNNR